MSISQISYQSPKSANFFLEPPRRREEEDDEEDSEDEEGKIYLLIGDDGDESMTSGNYLDSPSRRHERSQGITKRSPPATSSPVSSRSATSHGMRNRKKTTTTINDENTNTTTAADETRSGLLRDAVTGGGK